MRSLWDKLPQPQWLVLRFLALMSAHVIGREAVHLEGWLQWLAYALAGLLLAWSLVGLLRLARRRWRR
ncbi:hypothetical protein R5M92_13520 [Halomonas sp. Bachu 37]|uniref:hypothetical protein n=1 Tax=Halomonas kashgarensis TaxID=3084920 RepID=UPI003216C345